MKIRLRETRALVSGLSTWRSNRNGRSFSRYRAIFLGGGFAGLAKLIGLLTVAISIPLTVRYLGSERYGMWMTISSLMALLSFADIGIGSGLVSAIAASDGTGASNSKLVSSSFYMLLALALSIACGFLLSYSFVPWGKAFGVLSLQAASEAGPSVLAFVLCFCVGLPFTVVQRMQMGLQESWRANLWQCGAAGISLVCVLIAAEKRAGVMWLVLAMNGGTPVAAIINSLIEFAFRRPEFRPAWEKFDFGTSRNLLRSSGVFVALQLFAVAGTASDSIIIAQILGAAAVGSYSVMYKLFQTSLVFGLFMYPLWPALGEALARGDIAWARVALRRAVTVSVILGGVLGAIFIAFGRDIVRVWVGSSVVPSFLLVVAFAAWIVVAAYGGAITSLLNNSQFLRLQLKIYGGASIAALALKVPMTYWLGPSGVVWATVIGYSLGYCLPAGVVARRVLR